MNRIALTIKEMNRLVKYGIKTDSASMRWVKLPTGSAIIHNTNEYTWELFISRTRIVDSVPTFTLNDMINLLPKHIFIDSIEYGLDIFIDPIKNEWNVNYSRHDCSHEQKLEYILIESSSDIITATYNMLLRCAKKEILNKQL